MSADVATFDCIYDVSNVLEIECNTNGTTRIEADSNERGIRITVVLSKQDTRRLRDMLIVATA